MVKVSVVIPLYNAECYVQETLECILNQSYQHFEAIVVDDASLDRSLEIVKSFEDNRIRIFQNDCNRGIAYTRNKGISLSKGEYIALMDDDDISPVFRLEQEVEYLERHRDMEVVCGHSRQIDELGNDLHKQWNVYLNPNYLKACLLLQDPIPNSSTMIRKSFLKQHNITYLENMYGVEDYRFWVECSLYGKIGSVDEVMLFWRNRKDNESTRTRGEKKKERTLALAEIQRYALKNHGFLLQVEEFNILNKVFAEEGTIDSEEEMKKLYFALKKIAEQAIDLKIDYSREVVTMCRKRFGEKVGKAFYLWE